METNYIWIVITACAIALGAIIAIVSMLASNIRRNGEDSQRLKHNEEMLSDLPCKEHTEKLENISINMTVLKTSVDFLLQRLKMNGKQSPSHLNEIGLKVYKDMDGEQFLNQYGDMLIKKIEERNPKTAYDLEEQALYVLYTLKDDDMFIPIKNILYNYPEIESEVNNMKKEVTIYDVCNVFRFPLRDRYLELHPELLPENYQLSHKEE
jgi:cellobiose-specific phosphotransferase system component IIB